MNGSPRASSTGKSIQLKSQLWRSPRSPRRCRPPRSRRRIGCTTQDGSVPSAGRRFIGQVRPAARRGHRPARETRRRRRPRRPGSPRSGASPGRRFAPPRPAPTGSFLRCELSKVDRVATIGAGDQRQRHRSRFSAGVTSRPRESTTGSDRGPMASGHAAMAAHRDRQDARRARASAIWAPEAPEPTTSTGPGKLARLAVSTGMDWKSAASSCNKSGITGADRAGRHDHVVGFDGPAEVSASGTDSSRAVTAPKSQRRSGRAPTSRRRR